MRKRGARDRHRAAPQCLKRYKESRHQHRFYQSGWNAHGFYCPPFDNLHFFKFLRGTHVNSIIKGKAQLLTVCLRAPAPAQLPQGLWEEMSLMRRQCCSWLSLGAAWMAWRGKPTNWSSSRQKRGEDCSHPGSSQRPHLPSCGPRTSHQASPGQALCPP